MKTLNPSAKVIVLLIIFLSSSITISAQVSTDKNLVGFLQKFKEKNSVTAKVLKENNSTLFTEKRNTTITLVDFLQNYSKKNLIACKTVNEVKDVKLIKKHSTLLK